MMQSARETIRQAEALDARRRHQIENQVGTINRLLAGGTYEGEIRELHEELAAAQSEADDLRQKLEALKGETAPDKKENTDG